MLLVLLKKIRIFVIEKYKYGLLSLLLPPVFLLSVVLEYKHQIKEVIISPFFTFLFFFTKFLFSINLMCYLSLVTNKC